MPLIDIEARLTDPERMLQETAHKFAEDVLRPVGRQLDRLADPADVIRPESPLWEVFRRHSALGLEVLDGGELDLSPLERARARALVAEELGWGDAGLAISLGVAGFHRMFARLPAAPR
jgi:alkylation response protein AidB-like acyl-CoA dehydrogenase